MENSSKSYKIYLVLLVIFAIISFVFGYVLYNEAVSQKKNIDDVYEIVKNGTDEQKEEIVDEINKSVKDEKDKKSKEDILKILDESKKGDVYKYLDEGKDQDVMTLYSAQFLYAFHGFMLIVVLLTWFEKKYLKGLNNVLRIILNTAAVVVTFPFASYILLVRRISTSFCNSILHI